MLTFWSWVDRVWLALASVRLTIVILVSLLLLSIPGMVVMQYNISNVDPGLVYEYDFWSWGQRFQLFTSYYSVWYVGLMVLLSMNLISCSVERWPQMWRLAKAKPVAWARQTFLSHDASLTHQWKTNLKQDDFVGKVLVALKKMWFQPVVTEDGPGRVQLFWQVGRWSRIANYLVHTSLLMIFAGGIISALYGYEGAANIPEGAAVDTFLVFKEGRGAKLPLAPGGLSNEKLMDIRVEAETFDVKFYEDFPGRPQEFISKLNIIDRKTGATLKSAHIRVNEPLQYGNYTFYQASYGRLGDFQIQARVVNKASPDTQPAFLKAKIGEPQRLDAFGVELVAVRASPNIQDFGPGVLFQEFKNGKKNGEPFWVLKNYPYFDLTKRQSTYGVIVDDVKELFFTGLQIGHDPGAPIYWLGCLGMLLGTFYALFVTHRKFYLRYENGEVLFAATIHRLPIGFRVFVDKLANQLKSLSA